MSAPEIAQVRRFNRVVTQRVGALDDRFLSRDRTLGEARLLWEIGEDGRDVRSLRRDLDLDSGYVSRLLRALEAEGLVEVGPKATDRRVRQAWLTSAGRAERAVLDARSDAGAAALLEPLADEQRVRLVSAMAEVERLLTASQVEIGVAQPRDPDVERCLSAYFSELDRRFDGGFDPALSNLPDPVELTPPKGLFLIARLRSEAIGCGALRFHDAEPAEIKRMWIAESARGLGLGRRLLGALERHAAAAGAPAVCLETNRTLTEAIAMYRSAGFVEVEPFNDERYGDHWFQKPL